MIIDKKNCEIINSKEIYLHDALFYGIKYEYSDKKIYVQYQLDKYNKHMKYKKMIFCNVVAFEMTACEIWGKSPHIYDFEISKENNLIKKILQTNLELSNKLNECFETIITFSSGDRLVVSCEYIIVEEDTTET